MGDSYPTTQERFLATAKSIAQAAGFTMVVDMHFANQGIVQFHRPGLDHFQPEVEFKFSFQHAGSGNAYVTLDGIPNPERVQPGHEADWYESWYLTPRNLGLFTAALRAEAERIAEGARQDQALAEHFHASLGGLIVEAK